MDAALIVKLVITMLLVCWAVRQGFFRDPGVFLSWPMFAHIACYRAELRCAETGTRVVPWDYMIHLDYLGLPVHLEEFLDFLEDQHGITVSGMGILATNRGYREFTVEESNVAVH